MDIIQLPLDFDTPKLCECGCGKPTNLAKRTDSRHGLVKGQPLRYLNGHQGKTLTHRCQAGAKNANWKGGISKDAMRYKKQFIERYPEKYKAHKVLTSAVRSGKIIKPSNCSKCGNPQPAHSLQGHHHKGYAPDAYLDVVWLCSKCHAQVTTKRPPGNQPGALVL